MLSKVFEVRVLDAVIRSAVAISSDYYARPNEYGSVDDAVAKILQNLSSRTGTDPDWPNLAQREAMYQSLLGTGSDSAFASTRDGVFDAATNYAEGAIFHASAGAKPVASAGEPALRQAFIDAMSSFRGSLDVVDGTAALKSAQKQLMGMFTASIKVLRSAHVARAFGVEPAPGGDWPLDQSGKGAFLIEKVSQRLAGGELSPIRLQTFLLMSRVAGYGGKTIDRALAGDHDKDLAAAIQDAYSWASSARQLAAQAPARA